MAEYREGDLIKARLSNKHQRMMTPRQQYIARNIIRRMRRSGDNATDASMLLSGYVRTSYIMTSAHVPATFRVVVEKGYVTLIDSETGSQTWSRQVANSSSSVGNSVCEALLQGMLWDVEENKPASTGNNPEQQTDDPSGSSSSGTDGEADQTGDGQSDQAEGEGSGDGEGSEQEGEGEGDSGESQEPPDPPTSLKEFFRRVKNYLRSDEAEAEDIVSNRAYQEGAKMMAAGLPLEAVMHSYCLSWPEEAKRAIGVQDYDPGTYGEQIDGQHKLFSYILTLVKARVPVLMIGPAGAGKGYLASAIAKELDVEYNIIPLTGGASITWLWGRHTPNGFIRAGFEKRLTEGGVFLFDELDAADPNMLITVNEALANGHVDHPLTGERLKRHEGFIPMAAANTYGLGADATYTGRERLDGATLDRWRMGRVYVEYDENVQHALVDKHLPPSVTNTENNGDIPAYWIAGK